MVFNKTEHGGDIYDKKIRYDFSVNINPLGTPETVRQAVIDSAKDICSYPDPCCRELINSLAEYEGVPKSYIMCGNGAAELIYSFCAAVSFIVSCSFFAKASSSSVGTGRGMSCMASFAVAWRVGIVMRLE